LLGVVEGKIAGRIQETLSSERFWGRGKEEKGKDGRKWVWGPGTKRRGKKSPIARCEKVGG